MKQDRDRKRLDLKKLQRKLKLEQELEERLDDSIEAILGRRVGMAELEALYAKDLALLGSLEAGLNNRIGHFREIIAAL